MKQSKEYEYIVGLALDDFRTSIDALRDMIEDMEFDSDFPHNIHMAKQYIAKLDDGLGALIKTAKAESERMRQLINKEMADFKIEACEVRKEIAFLRQLRYEKARQNYLHMQALKAAQEEAASENQEVEGTEDKESDNLQ